MKIDDLLGKSFQYGGRGPLEYDCYGLVMEIYKRRGVSLPDFGSSPSASWIHRPPFTTHIGVVLEDGYRFIHIMTKTEVTIERLDSLLWKRRITGFFKPQMNTD